MTAARPGIGHEPTETVGPLGRKGRSAGEEGRLVLVLGIAGWNLMVFLPRAAQAARP